MLVEDCIGLDPHTAPHRLRPNSLILFPSAYSTAFAALIQIWGAECVPKVTYLSTTFRWISCSQCSSSVFSPMSGFTFDSVTPATFTPDQTATRKQANASEQANEIELTAGITVLSDDPSVAGRWGNKLNIAPSSCHGWIIGEHGDSSVAVWSGVNVAGVTLSNVKPDIGEKTDDEHWEQDIHRKVVERVTVLSDDPSVAGRWGNVEFLGKKEAEPVMDIYGIKMSTNIYLSLY
ncbi:hypothetical protein ANCCEY_13569 [Ancylostoma ceylanicum]|uniref:L-lactate dehydrogenase n=1 Tax=Ancylostoma ceylanicum TaxID=53326 RepID=A0A0D6L6R3_9BILA|nr:hypothetical protein ANCCEY_13569 [Ancylostoma ceylanicum]